MVAFRQAERILLSAQVLQDVSSEAELNLLVLGERGEDFFIFRARDEAVRFGDDSCIYRMVSWRENAQYSS